MIPELLNLSNLYDDEQRKKQDRSKLASPYSGIESFEEDIKDIENDIEGREEKLSILEANLSN